MRAATASGNPDVMAYSVAASRITVRSLVFVLLGALAACSVGQPYTRPDMQVAATWQTPGDQQPAWPDAEWWRAFGSPALNDLIAEARETNFDIGAAVARMREADAQVRIAGGGLLPAVEFGASTVHERQPSKGVSSRGSETVSNLQTASISAGYEVDFWGRNRATVAGARATSLASRYDRDTVELSVTSSVATIYFQILALRDRVVATRSNLQNASDILTAVRARLAAGVATALDTAQQETAVAVLDASLPPLETALQQNINALAILVGRLPEALDIPTGTLTDMSPPALTPGLPSVLLERRPDIAAAEAGLQAANADLTVARAAFFPSVQLTVQGGVESAALASLFNPASTFLTLGASLAQPLFAGGRLKGQYLAAESRYDELVQNYRKTVISAFGDVEDTLVATRETAEQERRQQNVVDAARRAHAISTAELNAGTVDVLSVLATQSALFTAEDTLIQVRLARLQAAVGLFRALGGGWEQPKEAS